MDKKSDLLKKYFGHKSFRYRQEEIIDCLCENRDILAVMPTGAGKSVCYQIPALMKKGITLVVSPLISLMKDQVFALKEMGIPAAYLNSSLTYNQYLKALSYAKEGKYKIIYVAPERLLTEDFLSFCINSEISMVAIDEAHCVSQWGQDFRPSYLKIAEFISLLPKRPVVGAFTATATQNVKNDIVSLLMLNSPNIIATGFDRPNLSFQIIKPHDKNIALTELVHDRPNQSGIIYCTSRKAVDEVTDMLTLKGYSVTKYHAGLTSEERKANQEDFVFDRKQIMVATNAFGMGIDKSNVAYVLHYNMPADIESYYQEAGRAGRDGAKAECILLYSPVDIRTIKYFIDNPVENENLSEDEKNQIKTKAQERLKQMVFYCTTKDCLRGFMLKYFGDTAKNTCNNCSNCLAHFIDTDITAEARAIIKCILETKEGFGKGIITDILTGSNTAKIREWNLTRFKSYGALEQFTKNKVYELISCLNDEGYICFTEDEYPKIKLTAKCKCVFNDETKIIVKIQKTQKPKALVTNENTDNTLFEKLKELRLKLAGDSGVPAFVIFTDVSLKSMCEILPTSKDAFLGVTGVGSAKLNRYGDAFIKVIKAHIAEKNNN